MIYYVFWRDDKLSHIVWLQWDRVDIVTICPREIHVYYVGVCVCVIFDIWIKLWQTIIFQFCLFFCFGYIYDSYCCYCVVRSIRSDSCFDFSFFSLAFTIWIDIGFDFFFLFVSLLSFSLYCGSRKRMKKKIKQGKKIIFVVVL